jgi:16S rRNA (guanine527-N7)-methyltransferase
VPSDWLLRSLSRARELGFLGPGPLEPQVEHAQGFATAFLEFRPSPASNLLDLGSGGGLPGLALAEHWGTPTTLLDSSERRTEFLRDVAQAPGAPPNIEVVTGRAEDLARDPRFSEAFGLVVARSFGPPGVVAECAARFLSPDGVLVVSQPPAEGERPARWSSRGLETLALRLLGEIDVGRSFAVVERSGQLDERYPRRVGVPERRPLF